MMSVERQIVLMLIQRKRASRRLLRLALREGYADQAAQACSGAENEAHNAAEIARRMLYGTGPADETPLSQDAKDLAELRPCYTRTG
jgi:hypothetical protein